MKKRIWNQLKKAVMVTVFVGIMGNCTVSAAEFDTQELTAPEVQLDQSAQWTDQKSYLAELRLDVSGLKELYRKAQEDSNTDNSRKMQNGQEESMADSVEDERSDVNTETDEDESSGESTEMDENERSGESAQTEENEQNTESGQSEENIQLKKNARYFLIAYISEYFQVDESGLKHDMQAESIHVKNQKGEDTEITKLICEVLPADMETDTFSFVIPVSLREEYRIFPITVSYPVCQDDPLQKNQDTAVSAGAYFLSRTEDTEDVLAVSQSAVLNVPEAKTGLDAKLQQSSETVHAGQKVSYVLEVKNTGELSLENIEISSAFSINDVKAQWESEDGFAADGLQGILAKLQPEETRKLRMTVQLAETQSGKLIHTVTVKTKHPGKDESIGCQASAELNAAELKAAFEVEKTADRTQAYPGDTITYQICIRNTGERTLHSVLSTERFQNAGIQAKFVQKEGVTLNSTGTQALIPQIAPGEAFALYATVTIPQYFASQELVNEVTVISDETGTQTMKSQANVTLNESENTITATPEPTAAAAQTYSSGYGYESKSADAYAASSKPRTGDETETEMYIIFGSFALILAVGVLYYMKRKKQN